MECETTLGKHISTNNYVSQENDHAYYCCSSPDNKYLATVYANGALRIFDTAMTSLARVLPGAPFDDLPCTCVKWFPILEDGTYLLVSVSTAGCVFGWSWDGATLTRTSKVEESNNEIAAVDVALGGKQFCTGGSDRCVRLYNSNFELTGVLTSGIDENGNPRPTHNNRIFSVRYITPTVLVSAGWGGSVQLWDLRVLQSRVEAHGHIPASDCVEPFPDSSLFLITSLRSKDQLAVVSAVTGDIMEAVSEKLCSHLDSRRLKLSRINAKLGEVWCVTAGPGPPSLLTLSIGSGIITNELQLPCSPLNMTIDGNGVAYISCVSGVVTVVTKA